MQRPAPVHIPYLDGWRGLAIGFLLVGHFFPVAGINFGAVGVNLFFVLSGFLMARLLFIEQVPLPTFYRRRISRIVPAAFVFIGIVVAGCFLLRRPVDWRETAGAGLFVINYIVAKTGSAVMPFGHIWSLSVEEHSYLVLSLAALAARARMARARTALGVLALLSAAIGAWYWSRHPGPEFRFEFGLRSEVGAFGLLASAFMLLCFHGRTLPRLAGAAVPLLAGFGIALHWWSVPAPVTTVAGVGLFALAINLLRAAPAWMHAVLSFAPLRRLGLWSFSIYLWQQPFYLFASSTLASRAGCATAAVLAGIASYHLVENPARAWLNRRWAPAPAPVAVHGVDLYGPMSSAPASGRDQPEATCSYSAPGLSGTPPWWNDNQNAGGRKKGRARRPFESAAGDQRGTIANSGSDL